jgi:tripartite-type tricarboxylate transporter receptor subunit TctC
MRHIHRRDWSLGLAASALALCTAPAAWADDSAAYPNKPIKLVVPFAPGGPNDVAARLLAPALQQRLKQPLVITNVPGAGGRIGSKGVAIAPADGYTLMVGGTNLNVALPASHRGLDYRPVEDFVPVGPIGSDAMLLAVHPGLPVRSVRELVEHGTRHPRSLSAGSAPGIGPHFVIEMFRLRTGADLTFVPYKGAGPAIQDTLGGHLAMTVTNKSVLLPLIQKGQLRALAVTSPQRQPELPDVPTLAESGVQGVPSLNWYGIMAPAGTPAPVLARVRSALADAMKSPEVLDGLRRAGLEPAAAGSDFAATLAAQRVEWAAVVKETGIVLE